MNDAFTSVGEHALFNPERMTKLDLARGALLSVGLNCFEPGQVQSLHLHEDADKFYLVLSGKARITIGVETQEAGPGTLAWAPAGVAHGVDEALERTVMVVAMAPPHE
jgi:quercetin dioxygenase-like cupin family protein